MYLDTDNILPDGKETKYAYDAAGRMIKEGDKTYEYDWLDKVIRVAENGKTLANFEYHNNGQIAKAVRENGIENFEWHGLALIERAIVSPSIEGALPLTSESTSFQTDYPPNKADRRIIYINEPHAGGGNPVLAIGENTEAIFTDMLGTSLGTTQNDEYSAISKPPLEQIVAIQIRSLQENHKSKT